MSVILNRFTTTFEQPLRTTFGKGCAKPSGVNFGVMFATFFGATFFKGCSKVLINKDRLGDFLHDFILTINERFFAAHRLSHHLHIHII